MHSMASSEIDKRYLIKIQNSNLAHQIQLSISKLRIQILSKFFLDQSVYLFTGLVCLFRIVVFRKKQSDWFKNPESYFRKVVGFGSC